MKQLARPRVRTVRRGERRSPHRPDAVVLAELGVIADRRRSPDGI
jgi:hypothetical protein